MTEKKINIDLIRTKLKCLDSYLRDLKALKPESVEEYLEDKRNPLSIERLFQLIVECSADINGHLIAKLASRPPTTYKDSFHQMGQLKILDINDEPKYYKYSRIRNALVHDYSDVNEENIFSEIAPFTVLFEKYFKTIKTFVNQVEAERKGRPFHKDQ